MYSFRSYCLYLPLFSLFFCPAAQVNSANADDYWHVDVYNIAYQNDYRGLNAYLDTLIHNPYASPDYIFQQVEQISKIISSFSGKQFHLPSMIAHIDNKVKKTAGFHIKETWIRSMLRYMEKRDAVYNYHNYCDVGGDCDEEMGNVIESVSNFGGMSGFPELYVDDYNRDYILSQANENGCVAPWTIDGIPPRIVYGFATAVAGGVMMASGVGPVVAVGVALEAAGILMIIDYQSKEDQKEWDKKRKEKHPNDIRQFDMKY